MFRFQRQVWRRRSGLVEVDRLTPEEVLRELSDSSRAWLSRKLTEGNFQAVLARSSVSSWVGSALPDPVLHTGQLNRWTLTSPFGRHGHGVCAWIADVDNWTSGVRHLLSVCMEQSPGRSS